MKKLGLQILSQVSVFIRSIPEDEQLKIATELESIREGDFESAYIKTLRGPIKELISRKRRIIFCIEKEVLYVLRAFTKKSAKTPKRELEVSEQIYALLRKQIGQNK